MIQAVNYKVVFHGLRQDITKQLETISVKIDNASAESQKQLVIDFVINLVEKLQLQFPESKTSPIFGQNIDITKAFDQMTCKFEKMLAQQQ